MALLGLFCFSTLLLFVNIEPFKAIGVFLSICYLPGLALFAFAKRDKLIFEDLLLAFPCSIGISNASVIVMLFIGVPIDFVPIIVHLLVGVITTIYMIVQSKSRAYIALEVDKQELLFCFFALLIVLLLSVPFLFGVNRMSIAAHAFHHSLIVTQILNGIFPPENPGLGGTIIGYYWGFHALIAALTVNTNLQQIQIMFLLNMVSLYVVFCIAYGFAKAFNLSEIYRYILPLAVIGLMRSDAGILVLMKLLTGQLISIKEIIASPVEPFDVLDNWMQGIHWFDPRLFFISKFYNVSGMPLAICLCLAYMLLLILILKEKFARKNIYFVSIGVVIFACFMNYPPLAIFPLLHAPLWTSYIFLSMRGHFKERLKESLKILLPYATAILFVLPYMLVVIKSRDVSSGSQGGIFSFDFYSQSLKNMVVFLMPLPVIVYGFWIAYKRFSLSREFFLLFIGTILSLILIVVTRWPFDNSYKFDYILIFFFAMFFVFALSYWLPIITNRLLNRFITTVVISALLITPLIVEASHIVSSFSTDYSYAFSGKHIIFAQEKKKNEAYSWIRDNTPLDALLMLSYIETRWPCCGMNPNYEPAALTERTLYVIKDADYTTSNPEYAKRVRIREILLENKKDSKVADFFTSLNRQVYLLVENDVPARFLVEDRFKKVPLNLSESFELKFDNNRQQVYLVNIKK